MELSNLVIFYKDLCCYDTALKFCKTCVAMKFVDDDNDDDDIS